MEENLSVVLHGKDDMRLENKPISPPGPSDVLLQVHSVGICGSDIKYWTHGYCGRFVLESPMVMGHEGSGTVIQIGKNVKDLKIGDRVAIEPGIPCRECQLCKDGRYNICIDVKFCATPPVDGNLCRYYTHPADFCHKLPPNVSLEEGALIEPLSVAVYSCSRGNVGLGSNVLICGAGPVGLLVLLTAKAMGAATVAITDIDEHRLSIAKEKGADCVIMVEKTDNKQLAERTVDIMGCSPDVVFECSGSDDSLCMGIYACKSGGCVVLIGRGSLEPTIPLVNAAVREIDIKGIFRYANCYAKAISMVSSGALEVSSLISHRFDLTKSLDAFTTANDRNSKAIKVIINCDK
ncbi:sorbitol dehydrogenase-like [Saccoglossus kowalevskii]|uniref:Sorbitol dehydrogenase-like n=1 Tax=Saccoglossus kowalevskii TaxID=10224 RepID=A0ABM0LUZ5_SACKO|nr:PREDICTED: sorbitol dehydrogenase-like [Saccoglossus kowalevskii]